MRALLIDRLPNTVLTTKADPSRALNGVKVTDAALAQALLKYGSYDRYYYIRESSNNTKSEDYENRDRLQALDLGSIESLRVTPPDDLLLFTSSHHIAKFVPFRQFFGHEEWPICGRTHGLSTSSLIPSYAWNYFSKLYDHDAIICTSSAGSQALCKLFQSLAWTSSVAGTRPFFPVLLPQLHMDGIETSRSSARLESATNGFVVLSIGRLTASHKADLRPLIAAFLLSPLLPASATLILAGDDTQGHIAPDLEQFAHSFQSSRKVHVIPDITAAIKSALLSVADVALCMSDTYQETFGVSVLEAMAAGLPVVAPDWDGYRDIVVHGHTGFLAKTCVYPDSGLLNAVSMLIDPAFALGQRVIVAMDELMQSLATLSNDKALAKQFGERGKQRAESFFSWKAVVKRLEESWSEQLERGRTRHNRGLGNPLGFMDYDRVFEAYPTSRLAPKTVVRLGDGNVECIARFSAGDLFSPPPIAGFSAETDRRIIEICHRQNAITIAELMEQVQTEASGPSMVATQVSRLIKYGLLSLQGSDELQPGIKEQHNEAGSHCTLSPVGL